MSLILIAAICAALWLILALSSRAIEKRWSTPRVGSLLQKEAVLTAIRGTLTLVKMATLTYGALLLFLLLLPRLGARMALEDYEAVLAFLTPVRGALSFFSGGLGQICFAIVIVVLAWRIYRRYVEALRAARHEQPSPASSSSGIGAFLVSKGFFKQVKLLGKYSGNFATIVFFLSLVGAGGSSVDQALGEQGVPSPRPMLAKDLTVEPDKEIAQETRSDPAPEGAASPEVGGGGAEDNELRKAVASALVDAFVGSPLWAEVVHDDMKFDASTAHKTTVIASASVELVESLLAKERRIPITAVDGRFDLALFAMKSKSIETPELGKMALDGLLGASIDEMVPEAADGIAGKSQKVVVKSAKSVVIKYIEIAVDRFVAKIAAGGTFFQALGEIRTLHRLDLTEIERKAISTIVDDAGKALARAAGAADEAEKVPVKPKEASIVRKPETPLVSTLEKPVPDSLKPGIFSTLEGQDPLKPGYLDPMQDPGKNPIKPGGLIILEKGGPAEAGLLAETLCLLARPKVKLRCRVP